MRHADIHTWLNHLGMSQYAEAFEANDVDWEVLVFLDERALKDIGVASVGHRVRLLKAIAELRQATAAAPTVFSAPGAAAALTPAKGQRDGERRQLTVLYCDVVGYTEMADRFDPELLQQIVRHYEDVCSACVARYEGYVFQRLGDGIVAFFGFPLAHEGEAERAIYAGLDILNGLAKANIAPVGRVHARIGVASGLVVISGSSEGAVGEAMNLASRLQGIAPVDSVVVSAGVQRIARGVFEYEDLGLQALKDIATPVRAYLVKGLSKVASRFEAATQGALAPMVGRDQEVNLLLNRWAQAQEGEGQVVLVSGEPGIGKSRMVNALRARIESVGGQALNFQASPYYTNSAYHALIDHLERMLRFEHTAPPEDRLNALEAMLIRRHGLAREDLRFIATLLSLPAESRYGARDITPQKHKDETLRVIAAMLEAECRRQPTVLVFEDAHWADPTTLEVLERLVDRTRQLPLLLVVTHRPAFEPAWGRRDHVTELGLSRLSQVQGRAVVTNLSGGKALPAELVEEILARTDGVPLFLEELTKAILESGQLKEAGKRYEYASEGQRVSIPATLRDSLMARLDRSVALREIAKIGAVIGREFSYELIATVANGQRDEVDSALELLTESGLAYRRGVPPEATYVFKHALVQDVAYDCLLKANRQELHARIARVIEDRFPGSKDAVPELLARHLTAAGESEAAIEYWLKAGRLALNRMALREAISHLDQGLKLLDTLAHTAEREGRELDMRTLLGTAWVALRGFASSEAWSNFHRSLALAKALGRHADLLPVYFGLSSNLVLQGRLAEGLDWVKEALAAGAASGDENLLLIGHRSACTTYFWLGDFERSHLHGQRALELYDAERHRHLAVETNVDPRTVVEIYLAIGSWILGRPDLAIAFSAAKDAHARSRGHAFDQGYALSFGAQVLELRGQPQTLLDQVAEAERLGQAQSLPFIAEVLAPILKGVAWIRMERFEEGMERLRTGMKRWTDAGGGMWMPYLRAVLAEAVSRTGNPEGGLKLVEESLAQIARPGWEERAHLAEVLRIKGSILQTLGKFTAAEESYTAAIEVARSQSARGWELRAATSLARLWQGQGKAREAWELLAPVYEWFESGFDERDLIDAKTLLDSLG